MKEYKCLDCNKETDKPYMALVNITDNKGEVKNIGRTPTCPNCSSFLLKKITNEKT